MDKLYIILDTVFQQGFDDCNKLINKSGSEREETIEDAKQKILAELPKLVEVDEETIEERRKSDAAPSTGNGKNETVRRKTSRNITTGVCKLEKDLMIVLDAYKLASYRQEAS